MNLYKRIYHLQVSIILYLPSFGFVFISLCLHKKDMERICAECGEKITGRSDKLFCCDMCRTSYHNRINRINTREIRKVNSILSRNRTILAKLYKTQERDIACSKLAKELFNFNYFTALEFKRWGRIFYYCYEYVYIIIHSTGGKKIRILKVNDAE